MDDFEIRRRVAAGEDSRTEFKRADAGHLPSADDISKALVAFANSGGGDLFFGVADDGSIAGVGGREQSDSIQRQVTQIAATAITPPLRGVQLLAMHVDGKLVVVARIPEFTPERPYRGKSKYFIRDANSSREAQPDELKRLLVSAPISYFDEQVVDRAERSDLDDDRIHEFMREAYPRAGREQTQQYLVALNALDPKNRLTVTGIVLFGREPTRFLVGAYASAVRFDGTQVARSFLDSATIQGDAFQQIEELVAFLDRHLVDPSHVAGLQRVHTGIPGEVWREAITNAVTHRDYTSPNQVRVLVFDDRVEILNPGELLNRLTVESIRVVGTKQPRNPHIAIAVARRGRGENLGFGVPEILQRVTALGLPEPEIRAQGGEFRLTVYTRV